MAKEKIRYTFKKEKRITDTVVSLILAAVSLLLMGGSVMLSLSMGRNGPAVLGAAGLAGMLLAAYAFFLGMRALSRRDQKIRQAMAAAAFSGVMAIMWIIVFLLGLG